MHTREDLIDWVLEYLRASRPQAAPPPGAASANAGPRAAGRTFLSEHDVRRRLTGDARELRIPKGSIVSPLAVDWLALRGIRVIEEDA